MKKYLAYYENEWPANIAELTAVENKPFVGYLKDEGVQFTVIPTPATEPADNEIWYTTTDGGMIDQFYFFRETSTGYERYTYTQNYRNDRWVVSLNGNPTIDGIAIGYLIEGMCSPSDMDRLKTIYFPSTLVM